MRASTPVIILRAKIFLTPGSEKYLRRTEYRHKITEMNESRVPRTPLS